MLRMVGWCVVTGLVRGLRVPGVHSRRALRRRKRGSPKKSEEVRETSSYPCLPLSGIQDIEWVRQHVALFSFAGMGKIETDTRMLHQKNDQDAWLAARRRLVATSSEFAAACFDSHTYFSRKLLLHSKISGQPLGSTLNPAIQFGLKNEQVALDQYRRDTGFTIMTTGLWTDPTCRFGASPDAIIQDNTNIKSNGFGLLEIKCLYSRRNKPSMPTWDHCPDRFYAQIQGQLYITGANFCDLLAWIPRNSKNRANYTVVRVYPDQAFHVSLKLKLESFANDLSLLLEGEEDEKIDIESSLTTSSHFSHPLSFISTVLKGESLFL
eukprot:CAMPEP_0197317566 /NCGR_PEP_ID=MMETSP0891-20130614/47587_1 /TAXON_ID=44058 ORGANISM="Aureoumbra lagunensis, Strain CCMP1510" /NCGR_SAMPLE_ID=MMETSP0891 /ASSEMBLY_ACC=CAM_ASM_000534 /LENGTH=322 /DNA_ID=CAMNT_0042807613 /DNA_START=1 /DNA_END=969 /DNA_ORIENTATION=+